MNTWLNDKWVNKKWFNAVWFRTGLQPVACIQSQHLWDINWGQNYQLNPVLPISHQHLYPTMFRYEAEYWVPGYWNTNYWNEGQWSHASIMQIDQLMPDKGTVDVKISSPEIIQHHMLTASTITTQTGLSNALVLISEEVVLLVGDIKVVQQSSIPIYAIYLDLGIVDNSYLRLEIVKYE